MTSLNTSLTSCGEEFFQPFMNKIFYHKQNVTTWFSTCNHKDYNENCPLPHFIKKSSLSPTVLIVHEKTWPVNSRFVLFPQEHCHCEQHGLLTCCFMLVIVSLWSSGKRGATKKMMKFLKLRFKLTTINSRRRRHISPSPTFEALTWKSDYLPSHRSLIKPLHSGSR